ncbi:peptidase [Tessaracoccus aquimaris]|uniref:Peptidase n=1 Tax=Tessaracoccus aquimaris TaxID=1332264 RepID=A0A1Q2CL69_9ACTN|nr:sodium:proton antiporter [Tessaracoccus aquimaris]AQP46841.1 peptidase [Tessaracoccus aquimaris]
MGDAALLVVAAVLVIVLVSSLAPRIGVASPVLMVLVGVGCSYIPGMPVIEIEPEWFLMIVLPPLLYSAAVAMPTMDFRRDFRTIGALSVGLVVVSALVSGLVIYWILPDIGLPTALALGAVISPPDAVAATSVGKRLGLPNRLVTILEGEGLVNDATALVLLRTALGATAGISVLGVAGDFLYAVAVGIAIGAVMGLASVWLRAKVDQPVLTTSISFVVPFASYIPAEELHASGVLAVVVAGLITGAKGAKRFTPHDRMTDRTNWRTIQHLLESGVFLLMGYQLHVLLDDVIDADLDVWHAIGLGLLATVVLIVVRVVFVVPVIASLKRSQRKGRERVHHLEDAMQRLEERDFGDDRRKGNAERFLRRRHADATFYANEGLGWRGGAVIAWSGMRGAVTLAAAQSLPHDVPNRSALMLVAFTVAIITLVGQGATLPWLIGALGVRGTSREEEARELGILLQELRESASDVLDSATLHQHDGTPFDPEVIATVRAIALAQIGDEEERDWEAAPRRFREGLELQRLIVDAEQAALLDARASGTYRSSTINRAQHLLDINAARFDGQLGAH